MRARRSLVWFATLAAGSAAIVLLVIVAVVAAVFGASVSCLGGTATAAGTVGPTAKGAAAREIPPARLQLFMEAGRRFDISWPFLASIGVQECGGDGHCGVAPSGCAGVMEIAYVRGSECSPDPSVPTLWERFGVDADGGGASILNPADAIFTAARIFAQDLGAPPAGGPYRGYYEAACRYYGACADGLVDYAHEVMARAVSFGFGHEGRGAAATHDVADRAQGRACGEAAPREGGTARAGAIVRVARSQLGVAEDPIGSNCTRYGPCEEWCALFVAWVWEHAGVPMSGGTAPYAYSGSFYGWVKEHGGRVLPPGATPAPGDAVLYGWGSTASEHVGIVEAVLGDEIVTIDGNFGDRVARVGPFLPALADAEGEPAPIYAYAEPPVIHREGASGSG
ncbi:MAG: CHAP domain-containing protein [Actinobacteria bacterium]|nr:CHAP domain-containing protein [Actinomycetota bacterium]